MNDEALADRLVNYADALTAVSFFGASGLAIAIMDPEVHCSMAHAVTGVAIGNVGFASIVTALLVVLRRWEFDLRSGAPLSGKSRVYSRHLHVARVAMVWTTAIAAITIIVFSAHDPNCPR